MNTRPKLGPRSVNRLGSAARPEITSPPRESAPAFSPHSECAKPLAANSSRQKCHAQYGGVDETFVQFYPTLVGIAKAKGTFKASPEK